MLDLANFFKIVRAEIFFGHLTQPQVDGAEALLKAWDAGHPNGDARWLAYCLATAHHETAQTMQPIEEYGLGKGRPYGAPDPITGQTYYGRGYVQLTWKANYDRLGRLTGMDLVHEPENALIPAVAAEILFTGMIEGMFTGARLADFFDATRDDPVDARRIVNGRDCAEAIANTYASFFKALAPALP